MATILTLLASLDFSAINKHVLYGRITGICSEAIACGPGNAGWPITSWNGWACPFCSFAPWTCILALPNWAQQNSRPGSLWERMGLPLPIPWYIQPEEKPNRLWLRQHHPTCLNTLSFCSVATAFILHPLVKP
ncbi:hypothetical protein O6H91_08G060000 [Diphasiastrum complanatum]|uniref:Uncharacterized protein n=1 Tax=Diphasiastrum complanatum TaxID=34168 RepID=A0ACC2CY40_DIPCM|nr:hypothetical protein O6H91_08G060000 [Diphasiastrum complanatum]